MPADVEPETPAPPSGVRGRPFVVACGFTTALLGDERTLREFIVAEHVRSSAAQRGLLPVLILVNDSYDPLNERQLRIGVGKDKALMERFQPFCGRPIAEIPDPFDCHASYSDHFAHALVERLRALRIYPLLLDTYATYRRGEYAPYVRAAIENYDRIGATLSSQFENFSIRNLHRAQCPRCRCVDATSILHASGTTVRIGCERCRYSGSIDAGDLLGKLSWKLDCAARWNLYGIHLEVFSKAHLSDRGTLGVARAVSREYFGGVCPEIVPYGEVTVDPEISYRLLEILPPDVLKSLFLGHLRRDLILTKDYVENFCRKATVGGGMSYVDFARRELPSRILKARAEEARDHRGTEPWDPLDDPELIEAAREFARFYYDREHAVRIPDVAAARHEDQMITQRARSAVQEALRLRADGELSRADTDRRIRAWLQEAALPDEAYHLLRRVFRQEEGPRLATLLAMIPQDHLELVDHVLELCARNDRARLPGGGREWSTSGGST